MFPACNLSGDIWFEADGPPSHLRDRLQESLGIVLEDAATEAGEFSYRSSTLGFAVFVTVTPKWGAGILCRFLVATDNKLGIRDRSAPDIPFERHLAALVERFQLGRLISHAEVRRRWKDEH